MEQDLLQLYQFELVPMQDQIVHNKLYLIIANLHLDLLNEEPFYCSITSIFLTQFSPLHLSSFILQFVPPMTFLILQSRWLRVLQFPILPLQQSTSSPKVFTQRTNPIYLIQDQSPTLSTTHLLQFDFKRSHQLTSSFEILRAIF